MEWGLVCENVTKSDGKGTAKNVTINSNSQKRRPLAAIFASSGSLEDIVVTGIKTRAECSFMSGSMWM